jgi:hypothetical protein
MQHDTLTDAAAAPAALTAFLRGIERRGAVFAQLQCGDPERVDDALAVAMRAFRNVASQVPVAEWPRRFWALLLASPPLRDHAPSPQWAAGFAPLATLGHGPRAALLLRLVAGLPDVDAAAVLGIARPTYRLALQRALPHHADGTPDEAGWHALGEAAQLAIRQLPADRLAHLARVREAAILGRRLEPQRASAVRDARPVRPRWWRPALAASAVATLVALLATFLPRFGDDGLSDEIRIRSEPLPPAEAPAATFGADTALLTHRDFELLAADAGNATPRDPGFHAWLVAQADAQRGAGEAQVLPRADAQATAPESQEPETIDAP